MQLPSEAYADNMYLRVCLERPGRCWWWCLCVWIAVAGCTRTHYRLSADRQSYGVLSEKAACTPWEAPIDFSIEPDPRSRFCDPGLPDDPILPTPTPCLYAYELPGLPTRDPDRFHGPAGTADGAEPIATGVLETVDAGEMQVGLPVVAIPKVFWRALPGKCRQRMFEFRSMRAEYDRTFQRQPAEDQRDQAQRLTLEDIIDLAAINSREYQTQKENLYRAALALTLDRYAYALKFSTGGNGTGSAWDHNRNAGITDDTLGVPTTVTGDKLLATGGDLLARFANNVVLTFNGPNGFAADIGSELLLELSQSVFQRDIVFEALTQAERNVVYAARDFARFRKELFRQLAGDYYGLLLTYRGIEISAQDYFTNLRAFNQGEAEYRAGQRSRVEVDQVEQNALASRSGLISSCNSLESGLDSLKLRIGLPPEMPLNIDLTELEELTRRDEATVAGERVRRAARNLQVERQRPAPDRSVLLNGAIELARRMLRLGRLRWPGQPAETLASLEVLRARLSVGEAQVEARLQRRVLAGQKQAKPPAPPVRIFRATMDLVDAVLNVVSRQLDLGAQVSSDPAAMREIEQARSALAQLADRARERLEEVVLAKQLGRIPALIATAEALLAEADALAGRAGALTGSVPLRARRELPKTLAQVDKLLKRSAEMLASQSQALPPVEIDMDDAMMTALVLRFELMNRREELADSWRRIKLAADELKSVLDLNASQVVRSSSLTNRPFDFTFDDSNTRLSLRLDTPFNRRAQRNAFRGSLIDYQESRRGLMQLEDTIKATIRDDLRQLELGREQYRIAVASAALAYERVITTSLQLKLGVKGIAARDFLEAQEAYTVSLNAVAAEHIGYILDRVDLFLDLELLEVDEKGFWGELYNEQHQPTPRHQLPCYARPAYGSLPRNACYSRQIKRMLKVPTGTPMICKPSTDQPENETAEPEEIPTPQGGTSAPEEIPAPPQEPAYSGQEK